MSCQTTCRHGVSIYHLSRLCHLLTLWHSAGYFTYKIATACRCIWISTALVPWCVSVCQSLWFRTADWGKEGQGGWRDFPLHQQSSGPFGRHTATLPFTPRMQCFFVRVLAQARAVVAGADRETGSVYAGLVAWGSGNRIPSVTSQSIIQAIEQLYISPWQHYCI